MDESTREELMRRIQTTLEECKETKKQPKIYQCPFCTEKVRLNIIDIDGKKAVKCFVCKAIGPQKDSSDEAITQWNQPSNVYKKNCK